MLMFIYQGYHLLGLFIFKIKHGNWRWAHSPLRWFSVKEIFPAYKMCWIIKVQTVPSLNKPAFQGCSSIQQYASVGDVISLVKTQLLHLASHLLTELWKFKKAKIKVKCDWLKWIVEFDKICLAGTLVPLFHHIFHGQ